MNKTAVKIENLVKRYKELVAVDHLNLEIKEGEIFGLLGPNGSGKTTTSAKLSVFLKKQNKRAMLCACDVYRPAAIDQLKVLGETIGVPVYSEPESKDPVQIALNAIKEAKAKSYNLVIIDTAGRLAVDEAMMNEIAAIKDAVNPTETLFVVDSMTGQDAVNTAKEFNDRLDFTGVILTKLDGDTRGGAALSIRTVVTKPIKFIGTGEKMEAIDQFHPNRMADRILGMGDVLTLIDKAQAQYDEKKAAELEQKIRQSTFTLDDYLAQFDQIKSMGNLDQLAGMIPGMKPGALKDAKIDERQIARTEAIILSMTPRERENPAIIAASRKKRIAAGAGVKVEDVNRLLKSFEQMQKMIKQFSGPGMGKKMKRMKGFGGFGGFPGF